MYVCVAVPLCYGQYTVLSNRCCSTAVSLPVSAPRGELRPGGYRRVSGSDLNLNGQADAAVGGYLRGFGGYLLDGTAAGLLGRHGVLVAVVLPTNLGHADMSSLYTCCNMQVPATALLCPGKLHFWLCPVYASKLDFSAAGTRLIGGGARNHAMWCLSNGNCGVSARTWCTSRGGLLTVC